MWARPKYLTSEFKSIAMVRGARQYFAIVLNAVNAIVLDRLHMSGKSVSGNLVAQPAMRESGFQRAEVGNGILLHAARVIYDERKSLAAEKSNTRNLQSSLSTAKSERDSLKVKRDRLTEERDSFNVQRNKLKKERDGFRQERDSIKNTLAGLKQRHDRLEERWNRERDSIRAGKVLTAIVKLRYMALLAILLLVIVGLSNPQTRSSFGRIGPALSVLVDGTPKPVVVTATNTRTPVPTVTLQSSATPPFARTTLPTATPRPSSTPPPSATPIITRTQRPAALPLQTATPRLFNVLYVGGRARACPRRDCDILARLTIGDQVTVLRETRGEQVQGSTLWYRIALPDEPEEAFVHSSLLGSPTPAPDG